MLTPIRESEDDAYDRVRQRELDEELDREIRFSHLRAFGRSAAHGYHALHSQDDSQTYAMERGTAVHAMLFGTRRVVGYPGAQRRGKEYDAFASANGDCEILTMAEYEKASRMADAVSNCKLAAPLLKGTFEETLRFKWMGLNCRATPDVRGADFLTELKTSNSSEPVKFTWQALRMGYHAQMRMQQLGHHAGKQCFIVCVESSEPYPVTVFEIDKRTLEIGEKLLVLWAERLKQSIAAKEYPPYTSAIFPLIAPEDDVLEYGDE